MFYKAKLIYKFLINQNLLSKEQFSFITHPNSCHIPLNELIMYLEEADRHLFLVVLELGFEFAEFLLKFAEFIILHVGPFCNTQNIRINDKI